MYTISNFSNDDFTINIASCGYHTITMAKLWFFDDEQFLFTLEKTFHGYQPLISRDGNKYIISIDKKYSLGTILKHFYNCIYKYWLYY